MLKPPIIWILDVCQDWYLNTGALWPNCKRTWQIIIILHEILHVEKKLCFNPRTLNTLKKIIKISLEKKIAKVCIFFFTVKTVLSSVDNNVDKTMPAWFQVQEFYLECAVYGLNCPIFITFSLEIGFGGLDTQS